MLKFMPRPEVIRRQCKVLDRHVLERKTTQSQFYKTIDRDYLFLPGCHFLCFQSTTRRQFVNLEPSKDQARESVDDQRRLSMGDHRQASFSYPLGFGQPKRSWIAVRRS